MARMLSQLPLRLLPPGAAEIGPGVGLLVGEDGGLVAVQLVSRAEIRAIFVPGESRISSAVFVQANGRGLAFQCSIQARISDSRACTLLCTPRRII